MKKILLIFCLGIFSFSSGQSQLWRGYFSYNNINEISKGTDKVYAAAANSYFYYDELTNELITRNSVDGLDGQNFTSFYHSESTKLSFVGFENGLLQIINEENNTVRTLVDIRNKAGIPPNVKKINHFKEHNQKIYISCGFGIVIFNLENQQFGDTFFIGDLGTSISVLNTEIVNNNIFATISPNGIRFADLSNPNLIDYNVWQNFDANFWKKTIAFNNQLIGVNANNELYIIENTGLSGVFNPNAVIEDITTSGNQILVTTNSKIIVLNEFFNVVTEIQSTLFNLENLTFFTAISDDSRIFIGTNEGMLVANSNNAADFFMTIPEGPQRNEIFRINSTPSTLWAVYGAYTASFNPFPLDSYGYSYFNNETWVNRPFSEVLGANDLSHINVNPRNEKDVLISSYHSGLLRLNDFDVTTLYTPENSGIEPITGTNSSRIGASAFDRNGNLWVTTSRVANGLKKLNTDDEWESINLSSFINAINGNDILDLVIDKNNTKWMATTQNGVIAYNENGPITRRIFGSDSNNLPSNSVRSIAIDNRDQLWIGTTEGLRILPSVDRFFNNQSLNTSAIIIVEDDLPQELLFLQFITAIKVDGANNKWIGTADSGVFLVSSNGQETLQRFTAENSPLPSNGILDIDINGETGEVFFVTDNGMVSYKAAATEAASSLANVVVYPNPVRPEYAGTVKITGLMDNVNLKITDIEGNLVYETTSEGGTAEWDTTAFGNYKVASGVYMIFIASDDGGETKVKKVMIVR
uniref:type IX secretion system anionic LPS delivery protein PorZ n=1 Tax=Flavobacterium sp. TaxID=239 RepID=UPI004048F3BD